MVMRLAQEDHDIVTAAVTAAERITDGEIVPIVAPRSDAYHDVALHYAVLAMLLVPAALGFVPDSLIDWWAARLLGWNAELDRATVMLLLLAKLAGAFLIARLLLAYQPLRMALTPGAAKSRRVRRRAIELFRTSCELRTRGRTGVLLYVSLAERRAEIVADKAVTDQVGAEAWGEAMAALVDEIRTGRPGEGMARAIEKIGAVLATILPPKGDNPNELPDRLVEL
jgi:putative membrane protein